MVYVFDVKVHQECPEVKCYTVIEITQWDSGTFLRWKIVVGSTFPLWVLSVFTPSILLIISFGYHKIAWTSHGKLI